MHAGCNIANGLRLIEAVAKGGSLVDARLQDEGRCRHLTSPEPPLAMMLGDGTGLDDALCPCGSSARYNPEGFLSPIGRASLPAGGTGTPVGRPAGGGAVA